MIYLIHLVLLSLFSVSAQSAETASLHCQKSTINNTELNLCVNKFDYLKKTSSYVGSELHFKTSRQVHIDYYLLSEADLPSITIQLQEDAQNICGVIANQDFIEFSQNDPYKKLDRDASAHLVGQLVYRYKLRFICEVSLTEIYDGVR